MAEIAAKLAHHIFVGEDHITRIEAQMQAASALTDHITDAMHAALKAQTGKASMCAGDGLTAVLDTINGHVAELRSWYRQLHELGVVRGGAAQRPGGDGGTGMTLDQIVAEVYRVYEAVHLAETGEDNRDADEPLDRRRDLMEEMASQTQADTIEGALFQLALAYQEAETLFSWVPKPESHHAVSADVRIRSILHSLRALLERLGGRPTPEWIDSYYMHGGDSSPIVRAEKALAAVDRGERGP